MGKKSEKEDEVKWLQSFERKTAMKGMDRVKRTEYKRVFRM